MTLGEDKNRLLMVWLEDWGAGDKNRLLIAGLEVWEVTSRGC
jgi:hypothetical protein